MPCPIKDETAQWPGAQNDKNLSRNPKIRYTECVAEDSKALFSKVGKVCEAGEILFREGDSGSTMFVIQSGRVRIFNEVEGKEKTLAYLDVGEFFGEMAILNNKPRMASAKVVESTRLLEIDAKTFEQMLVDNTEIALRLIKRMANRLENANEIIDILMHRDPKARVILGLKQEADLHGQPQNDGSIIIPLTQEQLSTQLGLTEAEVKDVLTRLERLNILRQSQNGFTIPDVLRLHEFLNFLKTRGMTA